MTRQEPVELENERKAGVDFCLLCFEVRHLLKRGQVEAADRM